MWSKDCLLHILICLVHSEELRQATKKMHPAFLVLLNTKQSDTGRCFPKDTDGSQPSRAQQILAVPSVFLLWTPCTDLVIIPLKVSRGSPWDYRKWLQPHREFSCSLSEKHHSPCDTIHVSLQSISEAAANEEIRVGGCDSIRGRGTKEMLPYTIPKAQGGVSGQSHGPVSLWKVLCVQQLPWLRGAAPSSAHRQVMSSSLKSLAQSIDWALNHMSWGWYWFQNKIFPIKNQLEYFNWGRFWGWGFPCKTQLSTCSATLCWRSVCNKYIIVQVLACCECNLKLWSKAVINVIYYVTPPIKQE